MGKYKFDSMEDVVNQGYRVVEDDEELDEMSCHVKERAIVTGDSISALATALNIRRQTLHYYLDNPKSMPVYLALKLAKVLDMPVEDLFVLGKDCWLIDAPPINQGGKELFNVLTLETVPDSTRHSRKVSYYDVETGEKYRFEDYKKMLNEVKLKYGDDTDKIRAFKKRYRKMYARLTKDMSLIANS